MCKMRAAWAFGGQPRPAFAPFGLKPELPTGGAEGDGAVMVQSGYDGPSIPGRRSPDLASADDARVRRRPGEAAPADRTARSINPGNAPTFRLPGFRWGVD